MGKPKKSTLAVIVFASILVLVPEAQAIPTFQVYIDGAYGGDSASETDTWFSSSNPITLFVVGAYGSNTSSLSNVTLVLSVPEGEIGTVTFADLGDGLPSLLTVAGEDGNGNPVDDANENLLSDVTGIDGYDAKEDFAPFNTNNHDPFKSNLSDFLLYSLDDFSDTESDLNNYNADGGTITPTSATGEQKEYSLHVTGFSRVHFDVYGLETFDKNGRISNSWDDNPASHDSTWTPGTPIVPEPGSLTLLGGGLLGALGFGRFSRKKRVST